jgi:hypothetical protein
MTCIGVDEGQVREVAAGRLPRRRPEHASISSAQLERRGAARVRACGCVPAIPETQSYVADILGLLHGAGDPSGDRVGGLEIRLVR